MINLMVFRALFLINKCGLEIDHSRQILSVGDNTNGTSFPISFSLWNDLSKTPEKIVLTTRVYYNECEKHS